MATHEHNTNESSHKHLSLDFTSVFKRTHKRFEKTFLPVLLLQVVALLIVGSATLLAVAVLGGLYFVLPKSILVLSVLVILGLIYVGLVLWAYCAVPVMVVHLINKPSYEYQDLFKKSWKVVPRVFTITALTSLAVIGGLILGVIPGIWLAILLEFVFVILVLEHKNHKETIAQSAYLVRGNFWNIIAFIIVITVIAMTLSYIPLVGIPLSIIFGIFTRCLVFELYKTLTHNKITDPSVKHTNKKLVNIVYALAAFAILALIVFATIISMLIGLSAFNSMSQSKDFDTSQILESDIDRLSIEKVL